MRPAPRIRRLGLMAVGPVALLISLALAGCGDKSLILRVDLLSFLTPSETQAHYGPLPGGLSDSITVTSSRQINLLPGIRDITSVSAVSIDAAGVFANSTGSGSGTVKIFISAEGTDPFTTDTTPIVLPITLAPATTDTVAVTISGDSQLADLFLGDKAQLGIRLTLQSAVGPALEGDFTLTTLRAVVTARQNIIN
ncbi:MAG: hypothetical protein ABI960_07640 [Candidatus Eisenbacteria bacterium]